ncbi:hypothetical protein E4U42_007799 [Claviceps africana]|uniref:t-SNARE coiled-coil homology domain-containing protein n=1 Tax=Claviceps africana TaxID=83212 RepID=A0A8K0JB94_9HYPO|nr:hypothetical protein E4U42_007799 [Claviceps africana]
MAKHSQLFLLADHIKLSLLERQRAASLNIDDDTHDGHISRSLDQFRTGLASLRKDKIRHEKDGEEELATTLAEALSDLEQKFSDLTTEFHGFHNTATEHTSREPPSKLSDGGSHASFKSTKTVRFSDTAIPPSEDLFGSYRDDPSPQSAGYHDQAQEMSNQQLQQYHAQIMEEQDEQLDRLGESIGRQRHISMQIGDELDHHVTLLDEMDSVVDRHQSRLDRAKSVLGRVSKGAGENKQMTAIVVLIIILVLLIAVLK